MAEQVAAGPTTTAEKISFEEFLRRYDGRHAEWIDGEVELMTPPSILHQKLLGFLHLLLVTFCDYRSLGTVLLAPVAMKIQAGERERGREPDLIFVNAEHADRIKESFVDGPADLAVEIISPESSDRDRGAKFSEYEAGGVTEYWLIDPLRKEVAFYQLGADRLYHRIEPQPDGVLHSAVLPGFRLRAATLWSDPLPTAPQIIESVREMTG